MKYIFIDTNIYIYCALITKGNYTTQTLDTLNNILNRSNSKLLMPEVIKLEFEKKANSIFENDVSGNINRLKKEIQNISFPDYLGEEKKNIEDNIENLLESRRKNLERVSNNLIKDITNNTNTILIELCNDIFLRAYKRALIGEKPSNKQICTNYGKSEYMINADCMIIESIIDYFKKIKINPDDELLFCSNNTKDFAIFDQNNNTHKLHDDIQKDIGINVKYYNNLPDLLKKEFNSEINNIEIKGIRELEIESIISNAINAEGIPAHIHGYIFLKEAILLALKDEDVLCYITKKLYPVIAKKFMTTPMRVERSIRHAIEVSWARSGMDVNNSVFENTISASKEKPTNSEFIAMIADKIRLEHKIYFNSIIE